MSYLNCRRCGLQIKIQAAYLSIDNCPRCLARSATVSPMIRTARRIAPLAPRAGSSREAAPVAVSKPLRGDKPRPSL